jgi:quercetin dioxygenase-like cupin family protein
MIKYTANNMMRGWFVGDFTPTCFNTRNCEVGFKIYPAGTKEETHHHKIATEITYFTKGKCKLNNNTYSEGDILVILPGEATDFEAITDVETVVVKIPGAVNDKYLGTL